MTRAMGGDSAPRSQHHRHHHPGLARHRQPGAALMNYLGLMG